MSRNLKKMRPEDARAISARLRALRLSTDMTQREFAARYGFRQQQWSNFESGQSQIGLDAALILLRKLLVPFDWAHTGETARLLAGLKAEIDGIEAAERTAIQAIDLTKR